MLELTRAVRFAINPVPASGRHRDGPGRDPNGYAGSPALRGLGRFFEARVRCAGDIDPTSTYLIDIKEVDRAVHAAVVPALAEACEGRPETDLAGLMPSLVRPLAAAIGPRFHSLRLFPTPYHSVEMTGDDTTSVLLRQKFDFSASHRLHIPSLSDEENRRLFGKCNHPSGHGHNYQVEPCIAIRLGGDGRQPLSLAEIERLVDETVIQRFDHKYLNTDTAEFRSGSGLNPSVENIARICFDLLGPVLRARTSDAELRSVTVWETDRTSATYPA